MFFLGLLIFDPRSDDSLFDAFARLLLADFPCAVPVHIETKYVLA